MSWTGLHRTPSPARGCRCTDPPWIERLRYWIQTHPTFGYHRLWVQLRVRAHLRVNRKAVYRVSKRQGWFAHQRAPPRRPRVRGWVSRPVIAMNTVLSHTQRRLRLVARVSAVQGGAADHSELGAVVRPGAAASSGYRSPINAERNNYPTWLDFRGALQLRRNTLMFQRPLFRSRGICCGNGGKQLTDCGGLKLLICTRLQYRRVSDR